ncbi:MAG: hypothetical protein ACTHL8_05010 [Burkholderiaceae bacterium]
MKSRIPHLSLAPPALESPSRFASRRGLDGGAPLSPRSRRARVLRRLRRVAWAVAVLAVLGAVFMSYFDRDLLFMLASQAWSCL